MRIIFAYYQNKYSINATRDPFRLSLPQKLHLLPCRFYSPFFVSLSLHSSLFLHGEITFHGVQEISFPGNSNVILFSVSVSVYESVNEFCDSARGIIRCCNKGRRNVNEPRAQKEKILPSFILQTNSYPIHERYHYDREGIGHYLSLFLREYSTSIRRNGQSKWL